jgi:hypothetical protein
VSFSQIHPSLPLEYPAIRVARPVDQFPGGKEQTDFFRSVIDAVRAVYQIPPDFQPQIAANGPSRRVDRLGRANRVTRHRDRLRSLKHHHDHRRRRDVLDQPIVKGLPLVNGVMPSRQLPAHMDELHPDDAQTATFNPR